MFKSFLTSTTADTNAPPLTQAELEAYLDDERQVALLEAELSSLSLLSAALKAGGNPDSLIAVADADGSLTDLLGCAPATLALEELQEKVEEASTEGKKVFWTKKKKVFLTALAATAVAVGTAMVAIRRLKSNLPATVPAPMPKHEASAPTPPKAEPKQAPKPTPNLPVVAGARQSHNAPTPAVGYGKSNPNARPGAQDQAAERSRMRETLLPYLRKLANEVHEQAYKSESALTHIRSADAIDKSDYGSEQMEKLMRADGYTGFDTAMKGSGFGNRTTAMVDKEDNIHTLLDWIDKDLGYIQKNSRIIPDTLKSAPPSVIDRLSPNVKSYIPTLKSFSESLGGKISTLNDVESRAKKAGL